MGASQPTVQTLTDLQHGSQADRGGLWPACLALARLPGSGPPAWLWPACLALARLPGSGPPAGVTLRPEARHIDVLGGVPSR